MTRSLPTMAAQGYGVGDMRVATGLSYRETATSLARMGRQMVEPGPVYALARLAEKRAHEERRKLPTPGDVRKRLSAAPKRARR